MTDKKDKPLIWKQGKGWVQYDPPRNHPCYEEWRKIIDRSRDNA